MIMASLSLSFYINSNTKSLSWIGRFTSIIQPAQRSLGKQSLSAQIVLYRWLYYTGGCMLLHTCTYRDTYDHIRLKEKGGLVEF